MMAMTNRDPALQWSTRTTNLAHFLTRNAARLGDRPAIIWGDLTLSWAQLDARVHALAAAMRDRFGISAGDRVLVQTPNNNQIIESMLACWRIGAVWVPSNHRQHPHELAYLAQKSDAVLMLCHEQSKAHAEACMAAHAGLRGGWRWPPEQYCRRQHCSRTGWRGGCSRWKHPAPARSAPMDPLLALRCLLE